MVEKIVMNFRAQKINVSGFAHVPLTSRLRSAHIDAHVAAHVVLPRSATRRLYLWGGYVFISPWEKARSECV